jgi:Reverse transcriptase (RNA-dependent DNA polymerase)
LTIDNRKISVLTLLDFSKAFDLVNHNLLLDKLYRQFQFTNSAVKLVRSYLCDRSQIVLANGSCSQEAFTFTGVPQGSVLGPILFSLFINDVSQVIQNCNYHIYADDLQIYRSRKKADFDNCVSLVNADLENIKNWAKNNGLRLNVKKTQTIRLVDQNFNPSPVKLDGQIIPYSEKVTDLG